ncbi:MAG TPA: LytR C-terminal domain-containing protein, partial [Acidimicrobiales bacterium]
GPGVTAGRHRRVPADAGGESSGVSGGGVSSGMAAASGATSVEPGGQGGAEADPAHTARWSPEHPRLRRRRTVVLAGMAGLTLLGAGLAVTGLSRVRNSTVGRYEEAVGADEPGYRARVVPTPTMGVLHRGADGRLVGAAVLALEPGDEGGSVILMPPATVVPADDGETTIAEAYRDGGAAAAARSLGVAVTAAVTDYVEVDDDRWAQLVEPVGPVEVTVDDAAGSWPAGDVTLDPEDVGPFLSAQDEGETDLDRLDRQQAFWNAWVELVGDGGADALPGEVGTGIGRFVRGVAQGGSAVGLPVARDDDGDGVRFRPDDELLGEFVSLAVPYPTSATPGGRVRVRLLNGTGDASLTPAAARAFVAAGAEIAIVGNAATLDVAETRLVYTGADRAPLAQRLRRGLDGGRVEVEEAATGQDGVPSDDEVDVTVILGDDAGDLIER